MKKRYEKFEDEREEKDTYVLSVVWQEEDDHEGGGKVMKLGERKIYL